MEQLKLVVLALCIFAAVFDLLTKRIPNWLTLPGMLCGLGAQFFFIGITGLQHGLLGVLVAFALFYPLFLFRMMGGGDVKLLMLIGAFTSLMFTIYVAAAAIIVGGVYALIDTLLRGRLLHILRVIKSFFIGWLTRDQARDMIDETRKFSFGVALALGFASVYFLEQWGYISL